MSVIGVLIADDHPLFRDGMQLLLRTLPDVEVLGEAASGDEAVRMTTTLQPDVVLMDIKMPGLNGIEATRQIQHQCPKVRVLIVTMFEDSASVFAAMRAGARGYVLKDADKDDLLRAIRAVGRGEAIFSAGVALQLLDFFSGGHPAVPQELFPELTGREREMLHLIVGGASNAEIARSLSLSGKTVANYMSSILGKLHAVDRNEVIRRAREAGLGNA
ncbi:response regulator transcription factor [Deinococcus peraridilitoris]|uniref:Response regulator containing a CheY-like receiver domain and an HTH DNA-binding domain protein n=1 Tax=Deinococcus peraridilitoris (strain DSM 19664 / LMG 22246 / CIP 109416 / KR-200) TaxID=937777 RepID=L0A7D9_DEIPD|nr:response regulator transcription factor [Deinococcus peraridilitoris]AFZ69783.1 response regulator containing a CheY-like receiver domain and an HTH DNA-binding domain protein [Deinococcus peraridilitoris DSM 19664]